MSIDVKWCEALLKVLEGDLSYNCVAEAKNILRERIDSMQRDHLPALSSPDKSIRGCLLAGPGRGDCEHFVGLPGKSIPGRHDGPDDTVDEYDRPNGWCEVCWRGRQIQFLESALFENSKSYGGQEYAELAMKTAKSKANIGIKQLAPRSGEYTAYVIEAKRLSGPNGPVYLKEGGYHPGWWIWDSDIDKAVQFCRRIDAERYGGKSDGTWEIVEHGFYD